MSGTVLIIEESAASSTIQELPENCTEIYKNTFAINHTLPSSIMAVITCTSMASNSTSDSECY